MQQKWYHLTVVQFLVYFTVAICTKLLQLK